MVLGLAAGAMACSPDPTRIAEVLRSESLPSPAAGSSRAARLGTDANGKIYLSWIEERETTQGPVVAELRFSTLEDGRWLTARSIASSERWFVNWADFPALAAFDAHHLIAHFLEKSAEGTYDYRVLVVRSADGGQTWSTPARLHSHAGAGEHGFVSWAPSGAETLSAVWLDGRNAGNHDDDDALGAMALYTRSVHAAGSLGPEILLDDRVCDCCPTAVVRAGDGALIVAYRDRSMDEVRDISVVRVAPGADPQRVWGSDDGWKIAGCPVNGPVLAAAKSRIGLAWFTLGRDGLARVLCSFSNDAGQTFSQPKELAEGAVFGRVDAVFDARGRLVVLWLEAGDPEGEWRVARLDVDGSVLDVSTVGNASSGRESGLARLAPTASGIVFASVESGTEPRVETKLLVWEMQESR